MYLYQEEVLQPDYNEESTNANDATLATDDIASNTDPASQSPIEGNQNAFTPLVVDEESLGPKGDSGPEFYEQGGLPRCLAICLNASRLFNNYIGLSNP